MDAFRLDLGSDGVARLIFDQPGRKVNTLGWSTLGELKGAVEELTKGESVRGLVLASGKPGQFVAGADLDVLTELATCGVERLVEFLDLGHEAFWALESLPFPSVALIDGACLGGGLELALACSSRLAVRGEKTRLGFPEVCLGLIPAWGGTQRAPRLIGPEPAMRMILGGEPVLADAAKELGLIDEVVEAGCVERAAIARLVELAKTGEWKLRRAGVRDVCLVSEEARRRLVEELIPGLLARAVRDHEAGARACSALLAGLPLPLERALEVERAHAIPLFHGEAAAARITALRRKT